MTCKSVLNGASLFLLLLLAAALAVNSALFLIGMTVTPFSALLSVFVAVNLFFLIRRGSKKNESLAALAIGVGVLILSVIISALVFDLSYDGNWYHKASLGSLANGWNPVMSSLEQFAQKPGGVNIGNLAESAIWADHYGKASWIIGADIYTVTGNIECAKAQNIIAVFVLFSYAYSFLSNRIPRLPSAAVALLASLNPITLPQLFTFYTDGLLMSFLFIIILLLLSLALNENDKKETAAALFSAIVICTNIKFTGLAYAAVFCFAFYLFGILDGAKKGNVKKPLVNMTAFFSVTLATALLLCGSSSYVKNFIEHKNPLYPLFGKDSVDIMTRNQPRFFDNLNGAQKLFYSLFSRTDNLIGEGTVQLKTPFDVTGYESAISQSAPDLRIAGYGPLFGGILIFSVLVLAFAAVYLFFKNRRAFFLGITVICPAILLLFVISEAWWARYSPHLYLLPLAALFFLVYLFKKTTRYARPTALFAASILSVLLAVNSSYFAVYLGKCAYKSNEIRDNLVYARVLSRNEPVEIAFSSYAYYGIEFNLRDNDINYMIKAAVSEPSMEIYSDKAKMAIPLKEIKEADSK